MLALRAILSRSGFEEIRSPEAFGLLTEALTLMPHLTINAEDKKRFAEPEEKLEMALAIEDAPLIHYNLGLIQYYRYGVAGNDAATEHFRKGSRTRHPRLGYLSRIAYARCLTMNYHRFGRQSDRHLAEARNAAEKALKMVREARAQAGQEEAYRLRHDEGYALYARAFAQHVTEDPEDIDRGEELYRSAIELLDDDTPAVIYNNLGYILMARVGRFTRVPGEESLYDDAAEAFEKALATEGSYKFTLANLANVERLRGNTEAAIKYYEEALDADPGYANGHNELAWVYLSSGDDEKARDYHEKALARAEDDAHRAEIMEEFAFVLHGLARTEEALQMARAAWPLNENNTNLQSWLVEHDPERKAAADE